MRRSTLIVWFTILWLIGLYLGHLGWHVPVWILALSGLIAVAVYLWRWVMTIIPGFALLLGLNYGFAARSHYQVIQGLINHNVTVAGTISDDPAMADNGQTNFTLSGLQLGQANIPGDMTIRSLSGKVQRGFRVQVTGKLKPTLGSKQGQIGFAQVQVISSKQNWLEKLRQRFIAGINTVLPDPLGGFALGLLIGARSLIPKTLQNQLALIGLSHLVAVSGYNLTIMVQALRRPLHKASRYVALAVSLWLITGFVVVAGMSASIIRAALVSCLGLVTAYYGRKIKPMVLVAIPALLTTLWRPDYLWSDVGWQLSFAAFIGILVAAPLLEVRLKRPNWIKALLIESLAAVALTFPIILAIFHQFSVVALAANIVILPLVPFAMLASFVAGIAGAVSLPLGLLALPAVWLLKLMLGVIEQFASLPWASVDLEAPTAYILLTYLAMITAMAGLWHRGRHNQISDGIMSSNTPVKD